ncbi:hypothetical protein [Roseivirga sp. E12]|uniref:hypothetical protein n=1 Tax=Roseivirga sp. E12 TaxID=2819237 RepID=UPI001ABC4DB2|nr:hypothetical protein [Roseivirga sp. E12]MBO3700582.1 hypothetical protein [Roseivirga sp. E12]
MFDGLGFSKSLNEDTFDQWLVNGRESKINYEYMLVLWEEGEQDYCPVYLEQRSEIEAYQDGHSIVVAAYHLFSETKISLHTA